MKIIVKIELAIITTLILTACNSTPSIEQVAGALKPIMPQNYSVKSVEKFAALDGIYEAVVLIDNQPTVLYIDKGLKNVISGSVVEIASKKNYTYEVQMKNKPTAPAQPASLPQQPQPQVKK